MDYIYYQRVAEGKDFTIGEFRISGTHIRGYFLEPGGPSTKERGLDRRIPPGRYNLLWHKGKHWSNVVKLYNDDVPIERAILIHSGNSGKDTEGCLIAGSIWWPMTGWTSSQAWHRRPAHWPGCSKCGAWACCSYRTCPRCG